MNIRVAENLLLGLMMLFAVFCFSCKKIKEPEPEGNVIAKIGNSVITETDLNQKLSDLPAEYRNHYENTESGRKQFIDALVKEKVIYELAKQTGIDKGEEYTDSLNKFKSNQQSQLSEYENNLLIELFLKNKQTDFTPSENDIKNYYDLHKDVYVEPVAYTVRYILSFDEKSAQEVYEKARNIGDEEKFANLAKEFSQDASSAESGGRIGPVRSGELVPEFEKAALSLKNGEVSEVVSTQYGYCIIYKVSSQKLPAIALDEVKDSIKILLERNNLEEFVNQQTKNIGVEVNYLTETSSATTAENKI
ncbi:MAG: peptidylprolyl isomerase [Elusimicrobiota bacterium]|jgi:parvulin-like peptidyl-prolyl isomerase|nr:peptidylprolyl isomerase [Elusimicrobiota bacterium]